MATIRARVKSEPVKTSPHLAALRGYVLNGRSVEQIINLTAYSRAAVEAVVKEMKNKNHE